MESITIQYETSKDCNLTQIGGLLDSKGYGIAVGKSNLITSRWPKLKEELSMKILYLTENGELDKLKEKWWTGTEVELKNFQFLCIYYFVISLNQSVKLLPTQ